MRFAPSWFNCGIMIELTPRQRRELRARAHALHPVVAIGQQHGLSPAVLAEIDRSLKAHELVKVRVFGAEREARAALLEEICQALDAAPVQHIGNVLVIWREKPAEEATAEAPLPTPRKPARRSPARGASTRPAPAPTRRRRATTSR